MNDQTDIAIVGTGPVGLIAALTLATKCTYQITLIGPCPTSEDLNKDTRTTAFMQPSINLLKNISVWHDCEISAAPLIGLRLIDDSGHILRAPDCDFNASELELDSFAQNIPNTDLMVSLIKQVNEKSQIQWIKTPSVKKVTPSDESVLLEYGSSQSIKAALCVAADGRNSLCRDAAAIKTSKWTYEQTAIACSFEHSRPHKGVSTEFHRKTGPMTLIPLKEYSSSLVWSLKPEQAKNISKLPTDQFCKNLTETSHSLLGDISDAGPRSIFPISSLRVNEFAANRIALVGEAAHTIPPIGAQGLNLGIRDCAYLAECLENLATDKDPGLDNVLNVYNKSRKIDVWSRTYMIDVLNKSLLLSFVPLKALRFVGLHILNQSPSLRQLIMQEGLGSHHTASSLISDV